MVALVPETLPKHVAVIMDGNGRWAKARGLPRTMGHKSGVDAARRTVQAARELGIKYLTLFGFSNENWSRPEGEIGDLMGLLRLYLRSEAADLHKNGVRLRVIGRRDRLAEDIVRMIAETEKLTADNTVLNLTIALDYGGRQDIVQAIRALVESGKPVTEENFANCLMTAELPEPDLLVRTSGEQRISNFLLWQCAYTEFVFTDLLWPDFGREQLEDAVRVFAQRQRRFGGVEPTQAETSRSGG
ncbi:MAG: di-trans,poly-cis-decaprenylcistransferase [Alphaproteobacteria bacterium]|nr:di-trans,poly-cis-decaprenylcistransferase [Alphaproteobacteria bacterium]